MMYMFIRAMYNMPLHSSLENMGPGDSLSGDWGVDYECAFRVPVLSLLVTTGGKWRDEVPFLVPSFCYSQVTINWF